MTEVSVDEEDGVWALICLTDFDNFKLLYEAPTDGLLDLKCL